MADFDEQILAVRSFVAEKRRQMKPFVETAVPALPELLVGQLPVDYSAGRKPFVVFRDETFVELGNPVQGSASIVLWSRNADLIQDARVTRIGPDVPEVEGQSLPFGQVILVGGRGIKERDLRQVERAVDLGHALDGYMIRRVPRKLWSRVSREAARKGFCFETLARALMFHYRTKFALLEAIEVLFVTSSKSDVDELGRIAVQAERKSLSIRELTRTQPDVGECRQLDCNDCPDKPTCDAIREVQVVRKRGKIAKIRVVRQSRENAAAKMDGVSIQR